MLLIVGIDNAIIIDTRDALLVCKKGQSQKIKEVVALLKEKGDIRIDYHSQDYLPWDSYTIGLKSQAERFHSYFGIPLVLGFLFL